MESDSKWPIVGHKNIINFLQKNIKAEKLAHAYIFAGSSNLGKDLVAQYFIKSVLCKEKGGVSCKKCKYCKDFDKGIYPDFYNIQVKEDKKNISIEQVRDVLGSIRETSFSGNYKIILIKGAEKLSLAAFNSLLKSLEEPSKKTLFILTTDNIDVIPETVISRAQIINFHAVDSKEILKYLMILGVNREMAREAVSFASGRPGLAIEYAKNKKLIDGYKVLVNNFLNLLNSPISEKLDYIEKIMGKKTFKEKAITAEKLMDNWLLILRDLLLVKNSCINSISHVFALDRIKIVSNNYTQEAIISIIDKTEEAKGNLHKNVNPQLAIENLTLNF